jgi:ABC-type transporter Mla subunit MlaD
VSTKAHNFRIGLFVLSGASLLVAALFAIGLKAYFGTRDIFETYVTGKVENLSVGALVKLRGVTIGKVRSIDFAGTEYPDYKEQYVVIQFEVPRGTVWSAGTNQVQKRIDAEVALGLRARVQGQGFLGASILALEYVDPEVYPVEPVPWTPKHYYIPSAVGQFTRIMASLEKTLGNTQSLDLSNLLDRANNLIGSANQLAVNVNQVDFRQLGTNAVSLVVELRQSTHGLQQTLADAQNAINGANLPGVSHDATALVSKLSSAALELRRVLSSLDIGELNSSLANIRADTDELLVLIHNLQQRPSSVVFSRPPKPLNEMEKPPKR